MTDQITLFDLIRELRIAMHVGIARLCNQLGWYRLDVKHYCAASRLRIYRKDSMQQAIEDMT